MTQDKTKKTESEQKPSGKVVEYIGAGREVTRREIHASDFTKGGHEGVGKQVWHAENNFQVPVEDIGSDKAVEWLGSMDDFKVVDTNASA